MANPHPKSLHSRLTNRVDQRFQHFPIHLRSHILCLETEKGIEESVTWIIQGQPFVSWVKQNYLTEIEREVKFFVQSILPDAYSVRLSI